MDALNLLIQDSGRYHSLVQAGDVSLSTYAPAVSNFLAHLPLTYFFVAPLASLVVTADYIASCQLGSALGRDGMCALCF